MTETPWTVEPPAPVDWDVEQRKDEATTVIIRLTGSQAEALYSFMESDACPDWWETPLAPLHTPCHDWFLYGERGVEWPAIDAEQFEREYAERSGITVEALRQWRTVRRCSCSEADCRGWAMVSLRQVAEWDAESPRFGQVAGPVIAGRP